jgi:[protein-PII] uridylyltransferase
MTDSAALSSAAPTPDYMTELKDRLQLARQTLRDGLPGTSCLELARQYSTALQALLVRHAEETARRVGRPDIQQRIALVATGGFGRGELVLFSDLDFCFITERATQPEEEEFIKAFLYPLWDLRVDLGYFVHAIAECLDALGADLEKSTAFVETRHIWGDESLTTQLQERIYSRLRKQHITWFLQALREEMRARHTKLGNTLFLLEPDVKNSRGGLRDVHHILWIAFASFGEASFEILVRNGMISDGEHVKLREAWEFLLRLRNTIHVMQNRRVDALSLERQVSVAKQLGFEATEAALAEELLMRSYYDHALVVDRLCQRLVQLTLERTPGTPEHSENMVSARVHRDFWRKGPRLHVEPHDVPRFLDEDPHWQMRLFLAAASEALVPGEDTLRVVEEHLDLVNDAYRKSREVRLRFLNLLGTTKGSISTTLRAMHRCGFLDAYLPEFAPIRNLPRIDHYHRYTVDEHLIRSVGSHELLLSKTPPPFSEHVVAVAREILRPDLLNLSLLLHDVGKGEGRGHVIRGRHAMQRVAERIRLRPVETDIVRNLVANHQKMSHMALRRDIEDPALARELAQAVGDPEQLKMLYVHTVCDMLAVSDESWNEWRGRLIGMLYDRTLDELRGIKRERTTVPHSSTLGEAIWEKVQSVSGTVLSERAELDAFLADMPERYLRSVTNDDAAKHFLLARRLSDTRHVVFRVDTYEGSNYLEVTFVARAAPGLFSTLCGALASKRINILSAQIYTAFSGEAVDTFQVEVPPAIRTDVESVLERLCERIDKVLRTGVQPEWVKRTDRTPVPLTSDRLSLRPPRVDINNDMSPTHTVIEISAPDRPGLLSDVAAVMDRQSVNIDLAFIATESYQVVDVFYVTDLETNKLQGAQRLNAIRDELLDVVMQQVTSGGT